MLTLLKQYKKIITVLFLPYLYVLFLLVAPTGLAVTAPGGITPVEHWVEIEGVDVLNNFHTVYVYSYYPVTAFQSIVLANEPSMRIYPMTVRQKDTSWRDEYQAGQIAKMVSLKSSIIQAYTHASFADPSIEIAYEYEGLYVYYRPSRLQGLLIGDQIVAINGMNYNGLTHQEFRQLAYQEEVVFTIRREKNGQISYETFEYIYHEDDPFMIFYPNYKILSAAPSFELPGVDGIIGGPSGGMVQTLSIYASLLKLNIGDIKIAGTGTIEMDGSIGRIGGIEQKLYTGIYQKIDIFFMPKSHENEIPNHSFPFDIVMVSTIEEAVQALNERIYE